MVWTDSGVLHYFKQNQRGFLHNCFLSGFGPFPLTLWAFPLCCFPERESVFAAPLLVSGVVIEGGRTGHSLMFLLRLIVTVASSQEF